LDNARSENRQMKITNKIGAIILRDKKILVVKKKGLDTFISPGGMVEGEETPEQTLRRELKEELGVELINKTPFDIFTDKAAYEKDTRLILYTYFVETKGEFKPMSEIESLAWIGKDYKKQDIKVASILEKFIIPKLIEMKLL